MRGAHDQAFAVPVAPPRNGIASARGELYGRSEQRFDAGGRIQRSRVSRGQDYEVVARAGGSQSTGKTTGTQTQISVDAQPNAPKPRSFNATPIFTGAAGAVVALAAQQLVARFRGSSSKDESRPARQAPSSAEQSPAASSSSSVTAQAPVRSRTSQPAPWTPPPPETRDLITNKKRRYIMVGGKGGVGKTSTAAAIAVQFASLGEKTLVLSTDPAHSLSDSFNCPPLTTPGDEEEPVPVPGIPNLWGLELDPEKGRRASLAPMSAQDQAQLSAMGMGELGELFEKMPPGFDETLALSEIVRFIQDPAYSQFDRIVFDTAPTGHTLRLLQFPQFLDSMVGKIISLRSKMSSFMGQAASMFGGAPSASEEAEALQQLEEMKESMKQVSKLFRDQEATEFVVVTIPTMMAIAETERLVAELRQEHVPVHRIVVNQVMPPPGEAPAPGEAGHGAEEPCAFCAQRGRDHASNIAFVERTLRAADPDLKISQVRVFDREIRGEYALRAMAAQLFPPIASPSEAAPAGGTPASA
eukprot:tig00000655_g2885.t1